jgi:hypothetical protein
MAFKGFLGKECRLRQPQITKEVMVMPGGLVTWRRIQFDNIARLWWRLCKTSPAQHSFRNITGHKGVSPFWNEARAKAGS